MSRGGDEDAGAEDGADGDERAVPGAQPADELGGRCGAVVGHRRAAMSAERTHWCARLIDSAPMADDVRIRRARDRADYDACVLLQRAVWGLADLEITSAIQLIATTHAGGMLHLAETRGRGGRWASPTPSPPCAAACPTCTRTCWRCVPEYQKRGRGRAPEVGAARGRARARHRPHHLDVRPHAGPQRQPQPAPAGRRRPPSSWTNFYGVTTSTLHHGLPTDRLLVRWELNSPRVQERLTEGEPPRSVPAPPFPRINDVKWQAGWPVSSEPRLDLEAPELLLEIPPDWDVLCQAAPRVAEDWHGKVAPAFQRLLRPRLRGRRLLAHRGEGPPAAALRAAQGLAIERDACRSVTRRTCAPRKPRLRSGSGPKPSRRSPCRRQFAASRSRPPGQCARPRAPRRARSAFL